MMSSKVESEKDTNEDDLSSEQFLRDIEQISKALYLHKAPSKDLITSIDYQSKSSDKSHVAESKSNVGLENLLYKNKKSSIWKWKPLKALNHFRNRRFNCCFFLHVHSIKGLPPSFNDLSLCVNWKRKDVAIRTQPSRVYQGIAEFEETLMHQCSVYGNRNGPQNSAKYEPKLFLLNAFINGAPTVDLGKHWIDVTRLLPLTLEELEEETRTSGKWTTSFKLSGKARGATINVSFSFSVLWDNSTDSYCFVKLPDNLRGNALTASKGALNQRGNSSLISTGAMLRRLGSVPRNSSARFHNPSLPMDIATFDANFSDRKLELARSLSFLYRKRQEEKLGSSNESNISHGDLEPLKSKSVDVPQLPGESSAYDNSKFTADKHRIELSLKEELKLVDGEANTSSNHSMVETIDVAEVFKDIETTPDEGVTDDSKHAENDISCEKSSVEELESILYNFLSSESEVLDSKLNTGEFVRQESYVNRTSSFRKGKMVRSLSLDDLTESVANDFLDLLGIEQHPQDLDSNGRPESPRERLLQQFEEESFVYRNSMLDLNTTEKEDFDFSDIAASCHGKMACYNDLEFPWSFHSEKQRRVTQSLRSKRNLTMLENLETEALMKKWGLDENDFPNAPRISSGGFGSPVHLFPEAPSELPPLGEGFGPIVRIMDGGFLKSMNPFLFKNAKNGARLVIQFSRPVVLPSAMGSCVMDIFEHWASEGVEKMCSQANQLMPLEDITGKTIEQVSWENEYRSGMLQRHDFLGMQEKDDNVLLCQRFDNFYSSSVNNEIDSSYATVEDLFPLAMEKIEVLSVEGLKIQLSMSEKKASSSIKPQSIANSSSSQNESFSFKGDVKLQLLNIDDVDAIIKLSLSLDEWIKLDSGDFVLKEETNDQISKIIAVHHAKHIDLTEQVKLSERRGGILGNHFTLALRFQLRDPFRNYEMMGASMLALIRVERIHIPIQEEEEEENGNHTPTFKIQEVHVAGLNVGAGDKQPWMNKWQQQSGIRWLLSSGMARNYKRPVPNSKAIIISSTPVNKKAQLEDILWSISSNYQGLEAQNLYVRNPDIIFPEKSI